MAPREAAAAAAAVRPLVCPQPNGVTSTYIRHIRPRPVNYLAGRTWLLYVIHRNSAMTALSPRRNKHGVFTQHVSLCPHSFTAWPLTRERRRKHTDTSAARGVGQRCWRRRGQAILSVFIRVARKVLTFLLGLGRIFRSPLIKDPQSLLLSGVLIELQDVSE